MKIEINEWLLYLPVYVSFFLDFYIQMEALQFR